MLTDNATWHNATMVKWQNATWHRLNDKMQHDICLNDKMQHDMG